MKSYIYETFKIPFQVFCGGIHAAEGGDERTYARSLMKSPVEESLADHFAKKDEFPN
jgi:hypothetical protein